MAKSIHQRKAEKRNARARERARQKRRSAAQQNTPFKDIPTYISGFLSDSHNLVTNLLHLSKLVDAALVTVEKMYQKSGSAEDEKKLHIFQGYKDTLEKARPHIADLYRRIGSIQDAPTNADKMAAIFDTFAVFSEAGETFQNIMGRFHEDSAIITGVQPDGTATATEETVAPVKDEPTEFEDVVVVDELTAESQPAESTKSEVNESAEAVGIVGVYDTKTDRLIGTFNPEDIAPVEKETPPADVSSSSTSSTETEVSGSSSSSN